MTKFTDNYFPGLSSNQLLREMNRLGVLDDNPLLNEKDTPDKPEKHSSDMKLIPEILTEAAADSDEKRSETSTPFKGTPAFSLLLSFTFFVPLLHAIQEIVSPTVSKDVPRDKSA